MVTLDAYSELLEALYSAPLDQEQWQRFLTLLCLYTNCKNGAFFSADSHRGVTAQAIGGSPSEIEIAVQYNTRYGSSDPFRGILIRQGRTGIFDGEELLPNEGLLKTDIYRNFVSLLGLRYATLIQLALSLRRFDAISIWRTQEAGPMDTDSVHLVGLLFPHVRKALEIHRTLNVMHKRLAGAEAVADASSTASFLVTREGAVVHTNVAAEGLVSAGECLTVQDGVLVARDAGLREGLRGSILEAASSAVAPAGPKTQGLLLPRDDGQHSLQVIAMPLSSEQRRRTGAEVMVLVTDPKQVRSFPDGILRSLYGLTGAETEVANGLLMGYSLDEIASLRRVSVGTVRNQVKHLMGKTGTVRQAELVRLLTALPHPPA